MGRRGGDRRWGRALRPLPRAHGSGGAAAGGSPRRCARARQLVPRPMSSVPLRAPPLRTSNMKKEETFLGKLGGTLARKKKAREGECPPRPAAAPARRPRVPAGHRVPPPSAPRPARTPPPVPPPGWWRPDPCASLLPGSRAVWPRGGSRPGRGRDLAPRVCAGQGQRRGPEAPVAPRRAPRPWSTHALALGALAAVSWAVRMRPGLHGGGCGGEVSGGKGRRAHNQRRRGPASADHRGPVFTPCAPGNRSKNCPPRPRF